MSRGMVTKEITDTAERMLGIASITTSELRLMPYMHHLVINDMKLDPAKVTAGERSIISGWRERGWITGGAAEEISFSKQFWDAVSEIMWLGYANHE